MIINRLHSHKLHQLIESLRRGPFKKGIRFTLSPHTVDDIIARMALQRKLRKRHQVKLLKHTEF